MNLALFYFVFVNLSLVLMSSLPPSSLLLTPALLISHLQSSPTSCNLSISEITRQCIGQSWTIGEKPFWRYLDTSPKFLLFALPTCASHAWRLATRHCLCSWIWAAVLGVSAWLPPGGQRELWLIYRALTSRRRVFATLFELPARWDWGASRVSRQIVQASVCGLDPVPYVPEAPAHYTEHERRICCWGYVVHAVGSFLMWIS
jgi:hypothetical protein